MLVVNARPVLPGVNDVGYDFINAHTVPDLSENEWTRATHPAGVALHHLETLTAPESFGFLKGATLSAGYTGGVNGGGANTPNSNGWMQENWYVGASIPTPLKGLSVGLAYDYTTGINFDDSYANALAAYLSYQATEKLNVNTRFDWVNWSNGVFGYTASTAGHDELFSLTTTVDYSLWANTITRLEFRWDTSLTGDKPFGGPIGGPPSDKNALSLGLNVIYMF